MNFQTTEKIVEDAVAPGDEEKELNKKGDQKDSENGSKGIKKINDEDHVIDINICSLLV